jgi:hypothetical protein
MDATKFQTSKYLKPSDLTHTRTTVKVNTVTAEEIGTPVEEKLVLQYTSPALKPHVVNATNLKFLINAFGADTDVWRGQVIVLFKTTTLFKGETRKTIVMELPRGPVVAPAPSPVAVPVTPAPVDSDPAPAPEDSDVEML